MRRVSSAEFVRNFSAHTDAALAEPVVLTRNGRDRLVLLSVERYQEILALAVVNSESNPELARLLEDFKLLTANVENLAPRRSRRG